MTLFKISAAAILLVLTMAVSGCGVSEMSAANAPCRAAAFYRVDDGELLYGENVNEPIAPASLTKLLTAATALRYISPEMVFTVGSEQKLVREGSSVCLIAEGQRLTLHDLIAGMLMVSGNDAAYTVAVSSARAIYPDADLTDREAAERFCGLMNDLAAELGMSGSRFTTPDGWDSGGQYTTVSDLLRLSEYALSVPEIRETAAIYRKYVVFESGENITWTNSNCLLDPDSMFYCENAVGLKTGTTTGAGNCLIAAFVKEGKTYISVAAGCRSDYERYELTLKHFAEYAR